MLTCFISRECRFITGTGFSVFMQTCHISAYLDANPLPGKLPASWQIKISDVSRSLVMKKDAQKLYGFSNACALLDPEHKMNVCSLNQF